MVEIQTQMQDFSGEDGVLVKVLLHVQFLTYKLLMYLFRKLRAWVIEILYENFSKSSRLS